MYRNDKYRVSVCINLDNGVYVFDDEASTGKTRLCNELKELRRFGEPVIGYTYGDDRLGIDLKAVFEKVNPKVLLLDRYDMYNGTFNKEIMEWSEKAIILIACKGDLKVDCDVNWCAIEMSQNKIEVNT